MFQKEGHWYRKGKNDVLWVLVYALGVLETDYPAGEEVSQDSEARLEGSLTGSLVSNSSHGSEGALSGISAVGCTAEGAGSGAHTGSSGTNELQAELSPIRGRGENETS